MARSASREFHFDAIKAGAACYVEPDLLRDFARSSACCTVYSFRKRLTSAYEPKTRTTVRDVTRWRHWSRDEIAAALETGDRLRGKFPSSPSDCFEGGAMVEQRPCLSANALLRGRVAGPWQQVIFKGTIAKALRTYDLNSAYASAASLGLPVPSAYAPCWSVPDCGIVVADLRFEDGLWPRPFYAGFNRLVAISTDELSTYRPDVLHVYFGLRFRGDPVPVADSVKRTQDAYGPLAKKILRVFWGRWMSSEKLLSRVMRRGEVQSSRWLPAFHHNAAWAYLVMSRIKLRLWEVARDAVQVYVDAVITPSRLPVGREIGQWKLVEEFPQGLEIIRPGGYIDLRTRRWVKHSGIMLEDMENGKRDDRLRQCSESAAHCGAIAV